MSLGIASVPSELQLQWPRQVRLIPTLRVTRRLTRLKWQRYGQSTVCMLHPTATFLECPCLRRGRAVGSTSLRKVFISLCHIRWRCTWFDTSKGTLAPKNR